MGRWVIMNTKKKMTLEEAIKWFEYDCTIIQATRYSDRGTVDKIYILGAVGNYVKNSYNVEYVTDTGNGYGGRGTLQLEGIANYINNRFTTGDNLNLKQKRTIWVFK